MLSTGESYESRHGTRFTVVEGPADNSGARIVLDRVMSANKGKADPHVHLDCDQHYEIRSGTATFEIAGQPQTLQAGDTVEVPRGTGHRDPFNTASGDLEFRVRIEPCPPFMDAFVRALAEGYETGRLTDQDELPLLMILVLTQAYDGQSFRTGIPIAMQRAILPLMAAIGRMRGFQPPAE